MVRVVQQTRNPDRANQLMCPHRCSDQTEHHPLCVWADTGSRVQAVPRNQKDGETK